MPATLLKVTLLNGCFSRYLNSTNGTKLHKASQLVELQRGNDFVGTSS